MKRFLSILLCLLLVFSLAPLSAFSDTGEEVGEQSEPIEGEDGAFQEGDRSLSELLARGAALNGSEDEGGDTGGTGKTGGDSTPGDRLGGDKAPDTADPPKTIRYWSNNGSGHTYEEYYPEGETVMLWPCGFTAPEGKVFSHWAEVDGTGTGTYADGASVTVSGDLWLEAVWKEPWAKGSIAVRVELLSRDNVRTEWFYDSYLKTGSMGVPSFLGSRFAQLTNARVELLDEGGNVLKTLSAGNSGGGTDYVFSGLKPGKYVLRLALMDDGCYSIIPAVVNGGSIMSDVIPAVSSEPISIAEPADGSAVFRGTYRWFIEYKAYGLTLKTEVGSFTDADGAETRTLVRLTGGNYYREYDGIPGAFWCYHAGIYYGDSLSQYGSVKALPVPVLSEEEAAKGYSFAGWRIAGTDTIMTEEETASHTFYKDEIFEAVWDRPKHTVSFGTDLTYGRIDDRAVYSYQKEHNELIDDIPAPTPRAGYEFVGWFTDLTTNVVPESEILAIKVDRDLHFYAKYRAKSAVKQYTVRYLPGDGGTLKGRTQLLLNAGKHIPTMPTVTPGDDKRYISKWKVTAVGEGSDLEVGDLLTETQIAFLEINYDLNLEAQYEDITAPSPSASPAPGETPAPGDTPEPSASPSPAPSASPEASASPSPAAPSPEPTTRPSAKPWDGKTSPKTGDSANLALWGTLLCLSLAGGAVLIFISRRHRRSDS